MEASRKHVNEKEPALLAENRALLLALLAGKKWTDPETGAEYQLDTDYGRGDEERFHARRIHNRPQPLGDHLLTITEYSSDDYERALRWLVKPIRTDMRIETVTMTRQPRADVAECPFGCGQNRNFIFKHEDPAHCEHYVTVRQGDAFVFACDDPEIQLCEKCDRYTDTRTETCTRCGQDWCEYRGPDTTAEARGEA